MNVFILPAVILVVVAVADATNVAYVQPAVYYTPTTSHSSVSFNSKDVKYGYNVAQSNVKYVVPQVQPVKYEVSQVQPVKYVVPQGQHHVVPQQLKYVYNQPQVKYVYQPNTFPIYTQTYNKAYPYHGSHVVPQAVW